MHDNQMLVQYKTTNRSASAATLVSLMNGENKKMVKTIMEAIATFLGHSIGVRFS